MKIGLYFGSFNPIHIGHLIIANHILNAIELNKIWFVVSPQNPLKKENSLLNEYDRLHLVRLAIQDDIRLKESDTEFKLPRPSYTVDTLAYLKENYPNIDFSIIMGSDSFQNIEKWKNYQTILQEHKILIYKRRGFDISHFKNHNINVLDAPMLEISSTYIRELLINKKSIRYLVPEIVREEIESRRFYFKKN